MLSQSLFKPSHRRAHINACSVVHLGHKIGLGTLPLPCLPTAWFQQTVLSLGKPWRTAKDERPDAAPCVLPRSASAAPRRWSPSPRSRISQPAAGPCPAASARSARAPASRYTAPPPCCCLGTHSGGCCSYVKGRVQNTLCSRPLPPPSACPTVLLTQPLLGLRWGPQVGSPSAGPSSIHSITGHGVKAWGARLTTPL